MNLNDLSDDIHQTAKSKGWWPENQNIPEKLAMIHSEVSEALDEYRNGNALRTYYTTGQKPEGMPSELADIIIRTLDLAGFLEIDIAHHVREKHAFNKTRPHRHGGKLA